MRNSIDSSSNRVLNPNHFRTATIHPILNCSRPAASMLLSPILSTILWAASHAAHAQPTRPLQSNGTVARGLWVNGEPVTRDYANTGQLGSASPCKPDDDLVECAKKIWQPYKPDPLMLVGTREARVPCYWVPGGRDSWSGYIVAKYKAEVSSCGLSDPVIISKQPTFFCNGGQRKMPKI